ncbi:MAG: hypothetical protein AAGA20_11585 [Planctomycetota bacterium]
MFLVDPNRRFGSWLALLWLASELVLIGCSSSPRTASTAWPSNGTGAATDSFALLREASDHEGLYTLAGGLKPMSTGIWSGSFEVDDPDLAELRDVRAALAPLRNGTWYADVQVFDSVHEGKRSAQAYVVHRRALATMIERFEAFWSPWGIAATTHPSEIVAVVDRMPKADRWRGYGYLFGFPAESVDFFVEAGLAAEAGGEIGPGKDRQFIQVRTYAKESGRFTYATPLDHVRTPADEALANEASRILDAYAKRRARMRDVESALAELGRLNRDFESTAIEAAEVRDAAPLPFDGERPR